jgi:hypothetical protein
LDFFDHLGRTILDRWQRADMECAAFADIAASALADRPPASYVDPLDVVRWVHEALVLPAQGDITSEFGQPPITVFSCEHFYIDVLFWVDGTTAIHQHRFSGAFHVMQGSSLQSTYRFAPQRRFCEHLLLGKLSLERVELLTRGDVRPIVAGKDFVHSLFHLDRPAVSVVVRTRTDAFAGPQYSYTRAGLAFDPFAKPEAATRKLQTLDLLHKLGHPDFERLARQSIQQANAFLAFQLLAHLGKLLDAPGRFAALLDSIRLRHEGLSEAMRAFAEEERRDEYIARRRGLAKQPEHRFFLALLLNLASRGPILDMVRRAHPDKDPASLILEWLADFGRLDAIHAWVAETAEADVGKKDVSILDVKLDHASLALVRAFLEGREDVLSDEQALARVALLQNSVLLRPLFVP